jgi:hypothetical protein
MMNNQLDWTQKVGDAMIGQQKEVAASIQRLRAKAEAAGNLKSTPQQKVTKQTSEGASAIVIEPTNPEVIYVPYYNPAWAYGPWPYPAYPPPYYPPPPNYGQALMTGMMFGLGVAAGSAMFGGWHWGWSGGAWGNSYTTVNVNKATNISVNNFNRNHYNDGRWNFDPAHRGGVPYRTPAEQQRYGQHRPDAAQREQFRGQLDGRGNYTTRPEGTGARGAEQRATQDRNFENRGGAGRSDAFDGINRGGNVPIATTIAVGPPGEIVAGAVAEIGLAAVGSTGGAGDEYVDVPARASGARCFSGYRRRRGGAAAGQGAGISHA